MLCVVWEPGDWTTMLLQWRRTLVPCLFIERTFYTISIDEYGNAV